jgi:hypothetical protein
MWQAWDLAADFRLAQLEKYLKQGFIFTVLARSHRFPKHSSPFDIDAC